MIETDIGSGRFAIELTGGETHSCAILDNFDLKCWGLGDSGRLGSGSQQSLGNQASEMGDFLSSVKLGTGLNAQSLHLGQKHTCVVLNNDQMKCFGYNNVGQLGQGHTNSIGTIQNELGNYLDPVDLGSGVEIELCFDFSPTLNPSQTFSPSISPSLEPSFNPSLSLSPTFNPSTLSPSSTFSPSFSPTLGTFLQKSDQV